MADLSRKNVLPKTGGAINSEKVIKRPKGSTLGNKSFWSAPHSQLAPLSAIGAESRATYKSIFRSAQKLPMTVPDFQLDLPQVKPGPPKNSENKKSPKTRKLSGG